jgi:hypothetical protein
LNQNIKLQETWTKNEKKPRGLKKIKKNMLMHCEKEEAKYLF